MGLRCLFGHEFEGREVERDRREDGAEVVVAYRTVETCARCGRRRVVSENKEIKPLRTGEEPAPTPAAEASTGESGSPPAPAPAPDAGVEATTTPGDDGADAASPPETTPPDASPEPESAADAHAEPTDASDDAAIILDDTTPPADADESPTTADTETADTSDEDDTPAAGEPSEAAGAWPAADADADDGFDAETPTSGGPTASTGADPAPWPDEGTVERDRNGTRFVRPEPADGDVDGATELHCPNCATAHAAASSSLRPGDVCPDCRKGYLAERAVESPGRNG